MQLDFSSNYIEILLEYSKFIDIKDEKITTACIGIDQVTNLPE